MAIETIFDTWSQAAGSALVRQSTQTVIESMPRPARALAPIVPTTEDKIKLERGRVNAVGLGKFKAIGASSPVYVPKLEFSQTEIELVQLSEQSPVDERLYRQLKSGDEKVRLRAGADLLARLTALQVRNENLSDWMVMTSLLTGYLPINFADKAGQGFVVDHGYDPSHLLNPGATLPWTNPSTCKPIDDIRAGQQKLANDAGDYGIDIWMNDYTYQLLIYSNQAKDLLTGHDRGQYIATIDDIKARLYESERVTIHVTDSGYRQESAAFARGRGVHTKWIPDGKILMLAGGAGVDGVGFLGSDGLPVIEQFDGQVLVRTGFDSVELRQGTQVEVKIDDSNTQSQYVTSTRMCRMNHPENVVVLTVV